MSHGLHLGVTVARNPISIDVAHRLRQEDRSAVLQLAGVTAACWAFASRLPEEVIYDDGTLPVPVKKVDDEEAWLRAYRLCTSSRTLGRLIVLVPMTTQEFCNGVTGPLRELVDFTLRFYDFDKAYLIQEEIHRTVWVDLKP